MFAQSALFARAALRCDLVVTGWWKGVKHYFGCPLSVIRIDLVFRRCHQVLGFASPDADNPIRIQISVRADD